MDKKTNLPIPKEGSGNVKESLSAKEERDIFRKKQSEIRKKIKIKNNGL